jgi:hypothetical protein
MAYSGNEVTPFPSVRERAVSLDMFAERRFQHNYYIYRFFLSSPADLSIILVYCGQRFS